jgi:hypothetical protein
MLSFSVFTVAMFPATSVTVPLITWLAPCVLIVSLCGQLAIGAVVAVQVKVTDTSVLFQPAAFAAGEALSVIVGGVVAILTGTFTVVVLPATSVAVPVIVWFAPCVLSVCGAEHPANGAVPGAQANVTTTLELFHPAEFGAGETLNTMVGGVFPMLRMTLAVLVLPAASVTVPVITWPAPSVLTVFGGEQLVMAETAGAQV